MEAVYQVEDPVKDAIRNLREMNWLFQKAFRRNYIVQKEVWHVK